MKKYACKILRRAIADTFNFFDGWRIILTPATFLFGCLFYWQTNGWPAVASEIRLGVVYGLCGTAATALLVLIWNAIRAPVLIEIADHAQTKAELERLQQQTGLRLTALRGKYGELKGNWFGQEFRLEEPSFQIMADTAAFTESRSIRLSCPPNHLAHLRCEIVDDLAVDVLWLFGTDEKLTVRGNGTLDVIVDDGSSIRLRIISSRQHVRVRLDLLGWTEPGR